MMKTSLFISSNPVTGFLLLTLVISLVGFAFIATIPGAQTPESRAGLPFWVIAVWSPTLSAIIVWLLQSNLAGKLQVALKMPPISALFAALAPLVVLSLVLFLYVQKGNTIEWSNFKPVYLLPLLLLNLFLGPLGEELGWRGFLYPAYKNQFGWLASALLVGLLWGAWHLPLWLVESPQAEISFWVFLGHTVFFSIFMGVVANFSEGSIWPAVLIHLCINVASGVAAILETHSAAGFYQATLWWYGGLAGVAAALHELLAPIAEC